MAVVFSEFAMPDQSVPNQSMSNQGPPPKLRLVTSNRRARPSAAVYRRRRLVAATLLMVLLVTVGVTLSRLGANPLKNPESSELRLATSQKTSYVVQPGDTWWDIARALQTKGDVRPLVYELSRAHHRQLQIGEKIYLPSAK